MTVGTIQDNDRVLAQDATRMRTAETALSQIRDRASADLSRYGDRDEIRVQLEAHYGPQIEAAEDEAIKAAAIARANARAIHEATQDATIRLTATETTEADARRTYIQEDCDRLTGPQLVAAVRTALLTDDRPALYNYVRYLPVRLAQKADGEWKRDMHPRDVDELQKMVSEARARLSDPVLAPLHARALDAMTAAGKLEREARKRRDAARRYPFQSGHEVSW